MSGCQRRGQISGEKENSIFLSLDCFGAQHLNYQQVIKKSISMTIREVLKMMIRINKNVSAKKRTITYI